MHRSSVTVLLIAIAIGGVVCLSRPRSAQSGFCFAGDDRRCCRAAWFWGPNHRRERDRGCVGTSKLPDGAFTTKRALLKDGNRIAPGCLWAFRG